MVFFNDCTVAPNVERVEFQIKERVRTERLGLTGHVLRVEITMQSVTSDLMIMLPSFSLSRHVCQQMSRIDLHVISDTKAPPPPPARDFAHFSHVFLYFLQSCPPPSLSENRSKMAMITFKSYGRRSAPRQF